MGKFSVCSSLPTDRFKSQTLNAFDIPPSVFKYTNIYYYMIQSAFRNGKSQGVLVFICRLGQKNPNKAFFILFSQIINWFTYMEYCLSVSQSA